jgi:hypothetical protein
VSGRSLSPERRPELQEPPSSARLHALALARSEADAAYAVARELVFDRVPAGPVDPTSLTPMQAEALDRLDQAERRLEQLRVAFHRTVRPLQVRLE